MSAVSETTTSNGSNVNSAEVPAETTTKASTPVSVPSSDDDPYAYKKRKLVRRPAKANPLKYKVWLAGHISALVFGSISFIFQILWLPNYYYINSICYRLALIGSIAALTATFSHKFGLHNLPNIATLFSHQNFQYLVLATVWIFTFKSVFKILPYFILALLHLGTMKNISFITKESDFLASVIAYDELVLILYLLVRTICFRKASGYQLTIFLIFYWVRILYNKETNHLFSSILNRVESKNHYWLKIKAFIEEKQQADEFN